MHEIHPATIEAFDALNSARHIIAKILLGLVGQDLAEVRRRHFPLGRARTLLPFADQSDQVGLSDCVYIHAQMLPSFSLLLNVLRAKFGLPYD
ncbi:hypothetical protein D3C81_2135530 [compost metagenome]